MHFELCFVAGMLAFGLMSMAILPIAFVIIKEEIQRIQTALKGDRLLGYSQLQMVSVQLTFQ